MLIAGSIDLPILPRWQPQLERRPRSVHKVTLTAALSTDSRFVGRCQPGRYLSQSNATACSDCSKGEFADQAGSVQCQQCYAGARCFDYRFHQRAVLIRLHRTCDRFLDLHGLRCRSLRRRSRRHALLRCDLSICSSASLAGAHRLHGGQCAA